jgi:hypothetical protein
LLTACHRLNVSNHEEMLGHLLFERRRLPLRARVLSRVLLNIPEKSLLFEKV